MRTGIKHITNGKILCLIVKMINFALPVIIWYIVHIEVAVKVAVFLRLQEYSFEFLDICFSYP